MAEWIFEQTAELTKPASGRSAAAAPGLIVPGDDRAHVWRVNVTEGGAPADLSGYAVSGAFTRSDGQTVLCAGSVSGGVASVTLDRACCLCPGALRGVLRLSDGAAVITVGEATFCVAEGVGDSYVDPQGVVPDVAAVAAEYDAMRAAEARALSAAGTAQAAAVGFDDAASSLFRAPGRVRSGAALNASAGGIHPVTGNNVAVSEQPMACRIGYTGIATPLLLTVAGDQYKYTVWVYSGQSTSSPYKRSLTGGDYTQGPVIIPAGPNDKYFRVGFYRLDGQSVTAESLAEIPGLVTIRALTDPDLATDGAPADAGAVGQALGGLDARVGALETDRAALDGQLRAQPAYNRRSRFRCVQRLIDNGWWISSMTVIGRWLYVFAYDDQHTCRRFRLADDGTVPEAYEVFQSNIGHQNTVDYCAGNGCLIAASDAAPRLYIFPGVGEDTRAFDVTAPDTLLIDLTPDGVAFGEAGLNVVWGPDDLMRYDLCYVLSRDAASNTAQQPGKKRYITLIQLGRGAAALSRGTPRPDTPAGAFNGTYDVVKTWTRDWGLLSVTGVAEGNNDACYFDGQLFELPAPTSTSGLPLMIHSFEDFGTRLETRRVLIPWRGPAGGPLTMEKEGIAIDNGHMYVGSHKAGLFVMEY